MSTLLLDVVVWDLVLNASGNIAVAEAPYALAQDAASAIRLFAGELWYDTAQGIPYFGQVLGEMPSLVFLKAQFTAAALSVPGVASAVCYLTGIVERQVTGQVQITDQAGNTAIATF